MLPIPLALSIFAGLDRILSLVPFNGRKTKLGVALYAILQLFPGIGQWLTPDLLDALDKLALALIAIGGSHGVLKDELHVLKLKGAAIQHRAKRR